MPATDEIWAKGERMMVDDYPHEELWVENIWVEHMHGQIAIQYSHKSGNDKTTYFQTGLGVCGVAKKYTSKQGAIFVLEFECVSDVHPLKEIKEIPKQ